MSARARALRAARAAPRWAGWAAGLFLGWFAATSVLRGWGLPETLLSAPGAALGAAVGLLLLLGAAAPLLDPALPGWRRAGGALRRAGLAAVLLGLPLSLFAREERVFQAGEGLEVPSPAPGLPDLRFGAVTVAPRGEGLLLSKTVSVEVEAGGSPRRVGLWPPAPVGAWRLAVLRYGVAPGLEWRGPSGRTLAEGFVMLGTLPKTEQEARLVTWTPPPNVMLGVGYFPPALEDLLTPPGSRRHLFIRLESAVLAGTRRDLTGPSAYLWLADGRPEQPVWLVQAFDGAERVLEARLRGGETARGPFGSVRIAPEPALWVEIQAVWDPFLYVALGGAVLLLAGLTVPLIAGAVRRGTSPRPTGS